MIKLKIVNRETGQEFDPSLVFINSESDGGSASIQTTLSNLEKTFVITAE